MYTSELAEIYDRIYRGRAKDYATESREAVRLIRDRRPDTRSVLDVACGTGSHLRYFAGEFADIEGIEGSADMLANAQRKLPGVPLHLGDMADFDLHRTFDALTCMFAVPHLASTTELNAALRCFARHVRPSGVLLVEPWRFPETFTDGFVAGDVVTQDGSTIARVSHSRREGARVHMDVHCVVAEPASGARHFSETHLLTLFTRAQYEEAFVQAGCTPTYIQGGPWDCGMFVAVRDRL